jgi:ubiquinone/menaquinone biosynthesis C-methylase UbiE
MALFLVLTNLALSLSICYASERPSIFNMPGVDRLPFSEKWENNACYQRLYSVSPETGKAFGDLVFDELITNINNTTNIPTDEIEEYYYRKFPNQPKPEIVAKLSELSHCQSPQEIMNDFRQDVQTTYKVALTGQSIDEIRNELKQARFFSQDPPQENSTSIRMQKSNQSPYQLIDLDLVSKSEISYIITPTGYAGSSSNYKFTPDAYYSIRSTISDSFISSITGEYRVDNKELLKSVKMNTITKLHEKLSTPFPASNISIPEYNITSNHPYILEKANQLNWDLSKLKPSGNRYERDGNFLASDLCRRFDHDSLDCGSVVIEEEDLHHAYHNFLSGKANLKIVDLGASIGFNSVRYALQNNQVILCDRSLDAIMTAGSFIQKHSSDNLQNLFLTTQSADTLTLEENSIDVVFIGYLIKYFTGDNIDKMLKNIFKYLKPSGTLFLLEITPENQFYKLQNKNLWGYSTSTATIKPFPKKSENWPGEIGQHFKSIYDLKTGTTSDVLQYNLTKVSEQDILKGLEQAGFHIEQNLTRKTDGTYNFKHMPAIQIIAVKP